MDQTPDNSTGKRKSASPYGARRKRRKTLSDTSNSERMRGLRIIQWNANKQLRGSTTELGRLLHAEKVHVAIIQETGYERIRIRGYESFRCGCLEVGGRQLTPTQACAGLCVLVAETGILARVEPAEFVELTHHQWVRVCWGGMNIALKNIYNNPLRKLDLGVGATRVFSQTIIAGDFNARSGRLGYVKTNGSGKKLDSVLDDTNLIMLQSANSAPTLCHKSHGTESRPDVTLVSADLKPFCSWAVLSDIGSDHKPILIVYDPALTQPGSVTEDKIERLALKQANWDTYLALTEQALALLDVNDGSMDLVAGRFSGTLMQAARSAIPRKKKGNHKPLWTKALGRAVKTRRAARRTYARLRSTAARKEWSRTGAICRRLAHKARRDNWEESCASLVEDRSGKKAWNLFRALNNKKSACAPIGQGQDSAKSAEEMAEMFSRHFAAVNSFPEEIESDRETTAEVPRLEEEGTLIDARLNLPLSMAELNHAISKVKKGRASGEDGVLYEFLAHLGPVGLGQLLALYNRSWEEGLLPAAWTHAIIHPIPKGKKDRSLPSSYRPISLTSCLVKLMEKMVSRRLSWCLEHFDLVSENQFGFRPGKRSSDAVVRLLEFVVARFSTRPANHVGAIFFDLKQAYDRVWRVGVRHQLLKLGVSGTIYRWITAFLRNRTISTRFLNRTSGPRQLDDGLPQGSPLSCILFIIAINDVGKLVEGQRGPIAGRTAMSLFVDDMAVWTSHPDPRRVQAQLDVILGRVAEFCRRMHMIINTEKTQCTVFTNATKRKQVSLNLSLENRPIAEVPNPKFLGVVLDKRLTMIPHCKSISATMSQRMVLLRNLAGNKWGTDARTLRGLYIGSVRSVFDTFAVSLSFARPSALESVFRLQRKAAVHVAGGLNTSPGRACEILSNLEPLEHRLDKLVMESGERYLRLERTNPLHKMMVSIGRTRLKRQSFYSRYRQLAAIHSPPAPREPLTIMRGRNPFETRSLPTVCLEISTAYQGKQQAAPIQLILTLEKIDSYHGFIGTAYTDGSRLGPGQAGSGALLTFPETPTRPVCISKPSGEHATNYIAEALAILWSLKIFLRRILEGTTKPTGLVIFSDAESVLETIRSFNGTGAKAIADIVEFSDELERVHNCPVTLQWIPAHIGVPGNERADRLAKAAAELEQPDNPVSYSEVRTLIKAWISAGWETSWREGKTGRALARYVLRANQADPWWTLERKEQSLITQLRLGHVPTRMYLARFSRSTDLLDPRCRHCGQAMETVEHLILCPELRAVRFSSMGFPLSARPTVKDCLYGGLNALVGACEFFRIALRISDPTR